MGLGDCDPVKKFEDGFFKEKELREWVERVKERINTLLLMPDTGFSRILFEMNLTNVIRK
jgi:hypothetical protein